MSSCDACGKSESMPYQCHHCGGTYCSDHRLPESHDCPGLDDWGQGGAGGPGVFDSGFDASVEDDESRGVADRLFDTGPGGFWAYFRGNVTYVFLGIMWFTFFLQMIVFPYALGIPRPTPGRPSPVWSAVFTIDPQHLEYVWTWVTSIFSHGGLMHIVGNSVVIFFFGRLVESYLGSKKFAALFLVSGILAGLGQMGFGWLQYFLDLAAEPTVGALGASGAALAIMGVLTVLNPSLRVYLWFFLPIPIWALTGFYFVASVSGLIGPSLMGGNVADGAHLVGLLIGLGYGYHVRDRVRTPGSLRFGGGGGRRGGPGGPGGPGGRRRGPF